MISKLLESQAGRNSRNGRNGRNGTLTPAMCDDGMVFQAFRPYPLGAERPSKGIEYAFKGFKGPEMTRISPPKGEFILESSCCTLKNLKESRVDIVFIARKLRVSMRGQSLAQI